MDLYPSDLEESVRVASEEYLRDNVLLTDCRDRPPVLWHQMAEMGWFGISISEDKGGIGLGHGVEALVFAEMGRHLAPLGAIAAAVAARVASDAGDDALADDIIAGKVRMGLAVENGDRLRVFEADKADHFVLVTDKGAQIFARDNADWPISDCLDLSTKQALIARPDATPRASVEGSGPARHQAICATAYALGASEAARDMASEYAKTREQFGKAIGSFQGIKHLCADMMVRSSSARAQLLFAALSIDEGAADVDFQLAAAKRLADNAAIQNSRFNIQVHGGIGMTDEADPHLVLKRAHVLEFISPVKTDALLV